MPPKSHPDNEGLATRLDALAKELERLRIKDRTRSAKDRKKSAKMKMLASEVDIKLKTEALVSSMREANTTVKGLDREIKLLRDEAFQELEEQIKIIKDSIKARGEFAKGLVLDIGQTVLGLVDALPIPSLPTIHYGRTVTAAKKMGQQGKHVSSRRYDRESPVLESPFGDSGDERKAIEISLKQSPLSRDTLVEKAFKDQFSEEHEAIESIKKLEGLIGKGPYQDAIFDYHVKSYAAAFFIAHCKEQQAMQKGIVKSIVKYVFDELNIPHGFKESFLSNLMNPMIKDKAKIADLLSHVEKKQLFLQTEFTDKMETFISEGVADRPVTARAGQKKVFDTRHDPVSFSKGMIGAGKRPVSLDYPDDFEEIAEEIPNETIETVSSDSPPANFKEKPLKEFKAKEKTKDKERPVNFFTPKRQAKPKKMRKDSQQPRKVPETPSKGPR